MPRHTHLSMPLLSLLHHSQQRRTLVLHGLQPPRQLALLLLLSQQCSVLSLQLCKLALHLLQRLLLLANLSLGRLLQVGSGSAAENDGRSACPLATANTRAAFLLNFSPRTCAAVSTATCSASSSNCPRSCPSASPLLCRPAATSCRLAARVACCCRSFLRALCHHRGQQKEELVGGMTQIA